MDPQLEEDMSSYTSLLRQGPDVPLETSPLFSQLSPDQDGGSKKKHENNFNADEDKLLVSAWLNTSLDPIAGTDMKSRGFWKKVENYFNEAKDPDCPRRSLNSLNHRLSNIQHPSIIFVGLYLKLNECSEAVFLKKTIFKMRRLYKQTFLFDHCWDLLKDEQKWYNRGSNGVIQKRKSPTPCSVNHKPEDVIEDILDLNEINDNGRPIGRKAAKERKKLSNGGIKDSAMITDALSQLKDKKKKAREERMTKYNSTTAQRAELLEIQKAQFEIQKITLVVDQRRESYQE